MDLLVEQSLSVELGRLSKQARVDSSKSERLVEMFAILSSVSNEFSVQHLSHEVLKVLASCVQLSSNYQAPVAKLLNLLQSRYSHSFRPSPKDVLDILRTALQNKASWIYSHLLLLIKMALQNMQGNPKSVFLYVCEDLFCLLSLFDRESSTENMEIIRRILSVMFRSNSNMVCLSAYLQSGSITEPLSQSTPKKRKSATNESYVAQLFDGVGSNAELAKLVLGEYVSRQRDLSSSDTPECFLLFSRLLQYLPLEGQINLWHYMSADLRMYRLRDEASDVHKTALSEFYQRIALDPQHAWKGLETVLLVDPVNFTDPVVAKSIVLLSDLEQTGKKTCLYALFHTFAIKGSLADLVRRLIEASTSKNLLNCIDVESEVFKASRPIAEQISAIDAMECFESLLRTVLDSENTYQKDCAQAILEPLMRSSVQRIPEHLCERATDLFLNALSQLVNERYFELKKTNRMTTSRLMLGLVDSLRKVFISQSLPLEDSHEKMDVIEKALNGIAQKDSRYRGAALIRLSLLCSVEVSVSDLMATPNIEDQVSNFIDEDSVSCSSLYWAYHNDPDWNSLCPMLMKNVSKSNFKAFPEQLVPSEWYTKPTRVSSEEPVRSGEVDSLLEKSRELITKYPRLVFTPVSLRRADFPSDILSLELAWANQTGRLSTLLLNQSLEALYGITVLVEEARRNKLSLKYEDIYSLVIDRTDVPLVAKARCLLALHGVSGLDQKESADLLLALSGNLLSQDTRDKTCVDAAYFCMFQALITGSDRRRIRVPRWSTKMHSVLIAVRGLIGSCISGSDDVTQTEAAQYVVRIWKTIVDSVSSEKLYRISKSVALLAGEYIRLSSKITNSECASILDRGCCVLLNKLSESERKYLHAILGKNDRESLKRLMELLERSFKYKGKV